MKNLFLYIIFSLLFVSSTFASKQFRVTANSLNVRAEATINSKVVGSLNKGSVINVTHQNNGWSQITYFNKTCYISSSYIEPIPAHKTKTNPTSTKKRSASDRLLIHRDPKMWYVYIVVFFSFVLFIFRLINDRWTAKNKKKLVVPSLLLITICILEVYYFYILGGDTYFCNYLDVGFGAMLINFILFVLVVINQLLCFFDIFLVFQERTIFINYTFYAVGAGITILGIFAKVTFWSNPEAENYIAIFYAVVVIVHAIYIIVKSKRYILYGIFQSVVFAIYAIGTMVLLYKFIPLLILATFLLIVFRALLGGLAEGARNPSSSSSNKPDTSSSSYESETPKYSVKDENGYERQLEEWGWGTYRDDKGDYWEDSSWGHVKRQDK